MRSANKLQDIEVRPLSEVLGAELRGLCLNEPLNASVVALLKDAFLCHQLLVVRDQDISEAAQVALARYFGDVQVHVMNQYHTTEFPELYHLSNLDADGFPNGIHPDRGTLHWHTDGSWREKTGLATIMYAEQVPQSGGETHFCDMYGAYAALDEVTKTRIEHLDAVHNLDFSRTRRHGEDPMTQEQRKAVPPVTHPIVRCHPETGRKCIYLGDHAEFVPTLSYREGRKLIEQINAAIIRPELVYVHQYQPRDLVMWDNRCILHRATSYDASQERRVMRRCTTLGDRPFRSV